MAVAGTSDHRKAFEEGDWLVHRKGRVPAHTLGLSIVSLPSDFAVLFVDVIRYAEREGARTFAGQVRRKWCQAG